MRQRELFTNIVSMYDRDTCVSHHYHRHGNNKIGRALARACAVLHNNGSSARARVWGWKWMRNLYRDVFTKLMMSFPV